MQLNSLNDITTTYRHIFLSPHLDDAVYSCGGTLGVQVSCGLRPLVITVFAGSPPADTQLSPLAREIQRSMGAGSQPPAQLVAGRHQEDSAALDYLQADYLWLDYPDAIYRGTPAYYNSQSELIGGEVNAADLWIDKQLAQDLLNLRQRLPDAVWYAPLGVGRHVDHQLVSSAADHLVQQGAKVYYYEDFPYVLQEGALDARLAELGGAFEPSLVEMSEMLSLRQEAAELYASQITVNFSGKEDMYRLLKSYTHSIRPIETVYLERYWTPR